MAKSSFIKATAATAAAALFSLSAASVTSAGESPDYSDLAKWQAKASAELSAAMNEKRFSFNNQPEGNLIYEAVISPNGDITDFDRVYRDGNHSAKADARRVMSNVDLPDLPNSYGSIKIRLVMNYSLGTSEAFDMSRLNLPRGIVTTRQLATNDAAPNAVTVLEATTR